MAWNPTGYQVNPIHAVAGVSAGAGVVDTGTQRVTLASNDPLVAVGATSAKQNDIIAALGLLATSGLTFSQVAIAQVAAGQTELVAAAATKVVRLHALVGTMTPSGTIKVEDGTADLTGAMPLEDKAGIVIPFTADARGCLVTGAVNRPLNITTVTGAFKGYAICSTATS